MAMIKKLWSSARGKCCQRAILKVDNKEDEVLKDKEDGTVLRLDVSTGLLKLIYVYIGIHEK